jgi:ribosomal protein S27E
MIEVLKHGNKKKVTCEECGAELRYQPEDVKKDKSLEGVAGYIEYIVCPDCETRVVVYASKNLRIDPFKDFDGGAYEVSINRTH